MVSYVRCPLIRGARTIVLPAELIAVDVGWHNYSEHWTRWSREIGDCVEPSGTLKYTLLWPDEESQI